MAGISVARSRRKNKNTTRITSARQSPARAAPRPPRRAAWACGNRHHGDVDAPRYRGLQLRQRARTRSTASKMLAPGCCRSAAIWPAGRCHAVVAHVLHRVGDARHVRQAHGAAIAPGQHQRRVVGRRARLVVGGHLPVLAALPRAPSGRLAFAGDGRAPAPARCRWPRAAPDRARTHRRQRPAADHRWPTPSTCDELLRQHRRGRVESARA